MKISKELLDAIKSTNTRYITNIKPEFLNSFDNIGNTCLGLSILFGKFEAVKVFLERKANPNILDAKERTALHILAKESNFTEPKKIELLNLMIQIGINLDALDSDGKTALHYALENGSNKLFSELLSRGADPNLCPDSQGTLLHIAIKEGKFQEAKILLERGVDPDIRDSQNFTSLHIFAKKYNLEDEDISLQTEVLSKLIERGF